jgi:hypothetical protein
MSPATAPSKTGVHMKSTDLPPGSPGAVQTPTPLPRVLSETTDSPVPVHARPSRAWSVFIFMKPDETLEKAAIDDVDEMKTVGRLEHAYVAVQVERVNDVERFQIANGRELLFPPPDLAAAGAALPERQRPADLVADFGAWALKEFPAERHLVVMWGHARGVGVLLAPPSARPLAEAFQEWAPMPELAAGRRPARPKPPEAPLADGLTIEDLLSAMKSLQEQQAALAGRGADTASGYAAPGSSESERKLGVLGLDSCYMSSIEVGYALREYVECLVASESFMQSQGWNYREVLQSLAGRAGHDVAPAALGEAIVRHVVTLPGDGSISMLRLECVDQLARAFKQLVSALRATIVDPGERRALKIVLSRVSFLKVRQFLDLRDLCHKLCQHFPDPIADAARAVLDELPAVVFHRATGRALGRLNGLSVYYPYVRASAIRNSCDDFEEADAIVRPDEYRRLAFVEHTGWGRLLEELYGD